MEKIARFYRESCQRFTVMQYVLVVEEEEGASVSLKKKQTEHRTNSGVCATKSVNKKRYRLLRVQGQTLCFASSQLFSALFVGLSRRIILG
jgi:hypothetical protein